MKRALPQLRDHRRSGVTRNEANQQQAHMKKLMFVGLDVHAKSITIALAGGGGDSHGEARLYGTIANDLHALESSGAR